MEKKMSIPQWFLDKFSTLGPSDEILVCVGLVFFVTLLTASVRYFQILVFKRLLNNRKIKYKIWDETLLYALNKPVGAFIWLIGITFAAEIVKAKAADQTYFAWIESVRSLGLVILITWFLIRLINQGEKNLLNPPSGEHVAIDKTSAYALARLMRIAIFVTSSLIVLQTLDVPISGVLAVGGAGSLAVGFAAKDIIANFFGGLMVFMDRPFVVGDWISSPEKDIEGTVEHIGWRTTRIRRFNKRALYVPNSLFATISVENPSRMTNRQIKDVLGLRYKDVSVLPELMNAIETMLKTHPDLDTSQTTFVQFNKLSDSSLDCQIYCFTKTTKWVPYLKIQQDVLLKILDLVKQYGAEVAFPTTTLELEKN